MELLFSNQTKHGPVMARLSNEEIASRIRARGRGESARLAQALGLAPDKISRALAGQRQWQVAELPILADFLGVPLSDLYEPCSTVAEGVSRGYASPPAETTGPRDESLDVLGPRDVPVLGAAEAHNGEHLPGMFAIDTGQPVDWVRRPPRWANRRDLYALYVIGDSMEPRYHAGDLIFVDPRLPARHLDPVVVQLRGETDDTVGAIIKVLLRRDDTTIVLRQYHPDTLIEVPTARGSAVHRVLQTHELFGL